MTFQVKARIRRVKKSTTKDGIGVSTVLYPKDLGASWLRAVPVKAPTTIFSQARFILNDNTQQYYDTIVKKEDALLLHT